MTLAYRVEIQPLSAQDGGGYLATVPDLPGCLSDGETPEEALQHVQDAIVSWIAAAQQLGMAVPLPSRVGEPETSR